MKIIKKSLNVLALCLSILLGSLMLHTDGLAKGSDSYGLQMVSISKCYVELSITDNGTATIYGKVIGKAGVSSTYEKATLQRYESGAWVDVEEWEASNNGRTTIISESYQVSHGTYRVVLVCMADSEQTSVTSSTKTY